MKSLPYLAFGLISLIFAGCSTTANMYPVEGPLSKVRPLPLIEAHIDGILGNTGAITMTMPDGELCKGKWSAAAGQIVGSGSINLFSQYGATYGSTSFRSTTGKEDRGQAIAIGNRGTIVEVEFYVGNGTANGFGLAKDNHGNIYKVLF